MFRRRPGWAWRRRAAAHGPARISITIEAIDLVLVGGARGADVYLDPREGKFFSGVAEAIDFAKEKLPLTAVGVVAFDFNKDGWMDLAFTHAGAPGISLWRNVEGKRLERVALPNFGWKQGWGIAWVDFDNDGWLDIAAVGEGAEWRRDSRAAGSWRCGMGRM